MRTTRATFFPLEESPIDNFAPQNLVPEDAGFHQTLRKSNQLLKPIKWLKAVLELYENRTYMIEMAV
jgi:hypothetical protein